MSRDDKRRKAARKLRNQQKNAERQNTPREGRPRWVGSFSLQLGKDPRLKFERVGSGVPLPVDVTDPDHMDGMEELTALALGLHADEDPN